MLTADWSEQQSITDTLHKVDHLLMDNRTTIKDGLLSFEAYTASLQSQGTAIDGALDKVDAAFTGFENTVNRVNNVIPGFADGKAEELFETLKSFHELADTYKQKSATFMMLGNLCTRRCGFCAVPKGKPEPIDFDEPRRVAYAVAQLGLAHAVITSVNRDDDNVGAARAFVSVIEEIRRQAPGCRVEVLTPDFQGVDEALRLVVAARPEILNHNIETVPRLYRVAKSGGRYEKSLRFLQHAKEIATELFGESLAGRPFVTKTGIIVGMGEEMHELLVVFRDLADRKVDILTIGQYLRPSRDHLPMARYYTPEEFAFLKHEAVGMGFKHVESGPLVRSSYHAQEQAESTGLA